MDKLAHTIAGAVERSSISRAKLYQLIKAGEITVVKIGRRTLVPDSELVALLDRLKKRPS